MEVSDQFHAPAPLPLGMNSDTHSLGGSWGSKAGLGGFGQKQMSAPVVIRTPDRLSHSCADYIVPAPRIYKYRK